MTKKYYPAFLEYKKAGEETYFVINNNDKTSHVISRFERDFLINLSGCKTLNQHLESALETDNHDLSQSVIMDIFNKWINNGFLRSEKLLYGHVNNNKTAASKQEIVSGCITCDRPGMLDRWLQSRITNDEYKNRKTPIIICDDTTDYKISDRNKKIIFSRNKDYPGEIVLINYDDKKQFSNLINEAAKEKLPGNIVNFALAVDSDLYVNNTRGGNRNTMILASAGFNLYSSDDDMEYRFFSRKNIQPDRYQYARDFNSDATFYPDMNTLKKNTVQNKDFKLLTFFESNISLLNSGIMKKDFISLEDLTEETAMQMEKNKLSVRAIGAGYCGGRWFQNPYLSLFQQGTEREYFHDSEKYTKIRDNGLNIKSSDSYIIHNDSYLMGGTFCIDNKKLLSPCFPRGRRDDTNFAIILHNCLEPGLTIHIPYALYHNPDEKPPFTKESFNNVSLQTGVYSTLILEKLTKSFINPGGKNRIKELGTLLEEFGKFSLPDFEEQLKLLQIGYFTRTINHINYLLDLYEEKPSLWAEDMGNYCKLLEKEALSSDSIIPVEFRNFVTKKEALCIYRNYLKRCGEMLYWWPEIWETAKTLNMEGRSIINLNNLK